MAKYESNRDEPGTTKKEFDKNSGMRALDLSLTPNVLICAAAGAVLGLVLAMWGTSEIPVIVATVIVFTVLSGIFGMFV